MAASLPGVGNVITQRWEGGSQALGMGFPSRGRAITKPWERDYQIKVALLVRQMLLSSVEQLEGELTAELLILPVGEAGKHAEVEDMCTDAIPDLQVRL